MIALSQAFATALQHYQAGDSRRAEEICRHILEKEPNNVAVLNLLSVLAQQAGRGEEALGLLRRAIALCPGDAEYQYNVGVVQQLLGRKAEAMASYRQALRLKPDHAGSLNNLGLLALNLDQLDEAEDLLRRALLAQPENAGAYHNLGLVCKRQRKLDEAVSCFRQAVRLCPNDAMLHYLLGQALEGLGQSEEAIEAFRQSIGQGSTPIWRRLPSDEALAQFREAVRLQPDNALFQNALGNLLYLRRQPAEALIHYQRALGSEPNDPGIHGNLGNVLTELGRPDEAEVHCRQAIRLQADDLAAHHNLANAVAAQGRIDEALQCVEGALRIEPNHPGARHSRALWRLQQGRFAEGWPEYEWRWKLPDMAGRQCREPLWDGSPLQGRTLLLWAEQGLGDTLQAIRFVPLVQQRGAKVVVECQASLVSLLSRCAGIDQLVPRGSAAPAPDLQAPLLSLPWLLGITLETLPAEVPYLFADPALVEKWRRELEGQSSFKIGIAWQGSPTYFRDFDRSIPLRQFASLARVPCVRLYSLQKGPGAKQLQQEAGLFPVIDLGPKLDEKSGAFMDTAAVMKCLDLVITSDTSVAHLAGGLGVPVWLALSFAPDWRWLLKREDSPWYPTMRLFRQERRGDWEGVFQRMIDELARRVESVGDGKQSVADASGSSDQVDEVRMIASSEAFATAVSHHLAGDSRQADELCRKILEREPENARALNLRGVLAQKAGRKEEALTFFRRAVALCPGEVDFHYNLGVVQQLLGRKAEAMAAYRHALHLKADHAGSLNNLGQLALNMDRLDEAEDFLRRAVKFYPDNGPAYHNLGLVCKRRKRLDEAISCFRQAARIRSDDAVIHFDLGKALEERGKGEEAIEAFRQAVRLRPDNAWYQCLLGNLLTTQHQPKAAIPHYEIALRLQPEAPGHYSNLGNVLTQVGRPEEAEAYCREAIRLQADCVNAHHNLASAVAAQGRIDEALQAVEQVLRFEPEHPGARHCRALWRLQKGRFAEAWPEYEWRWKLPDMAGRQCREPLWDGSPLQGRTLLLWAEQGLGDTLQAIRFVPLVQQRGGSESSRLAPRAGRVVVECQAPLVPLLSRCAGIDQLVPRGSAAPAADVQAPLFSLPWLLGTTLETLPAEPYLFADPALVEKWQQELQGPSGLKVGIAWQGNPLYSGDCMRSIPLKHFAALARLTGIRLFSLQKGFGSEQLQTLADPFYVVDLGCRLDEKTGAFMDTAAVMQNLDLIITSDTSVAHLAGGLGRPVWVALCLGCDWRFFMDREDNPWYPSMRLFRQKRFGDWDDVFARIADALARRAATVRERIPHHSPADLAQLGKRALAHFEAGEREATEQICRELLAAEPCHAEALNLLGVLAHQAGDNQLARQRLERAAALRPQDAGIHYNLGVARHMLGQTEEAAASYRQALRFQPEHTSAFDNLGHALLALGQYAEAQKHLEQAVRLRPDHADSYNRLGIVARQQGRLNEAVAHYRKAVQLAPNLAAAHHNLGLALVHLGRYEEALTSYNQAVQFDSEHSEARFARAMLWLLQGDFERGWRDYEYRWQHRPAPKPAGPQPLWDGSPLRGQTILLWAEQGYGDTIQFIRYAPLVKQQGGTVVVLCPPQLARLLSSCPGIDRVVPHQAPLPAYDVQAPLMSLPRILGTRPETIPANVPYLSVPDDLIERWRRELNGPEGFRVGIVWQGDPSHVSDRARSIPLPHFASLARVAGVQLFSLQKGAGQEQLQEAAGLFPVTDVGSRLDDFADTAAVIKCLDLVIACDTSVAHLAGALGVPVWLALAFAPEWRWLLKREDSPWYPTVRLFRQPQGGDWESVFQRMAGELGRKVGAAPALELLVPVAPGELIDKITILEIKTERICNVVKLANVRTELAELTTVRQRWLPHSTELARLTGELKAVNEALWQVEDDLRECERAGDFGPRFIQLARSVYHHNDRRAALKRDINVLLGSRIIEEKSYTEYATANGSEEKRDNLPPPARPGRRATICILTYGDYLAYFQRCLESVLAHTPWEAFELRLGFNAAPESWDYARQRLSAAGDVDIVQLPEGIERQSYQSAGGIPVSIWNSPVNVYKEPMCRLLYHDRPLTTEYALWFDDDSYVEHGWWEALLHVLDGKIDYVGQDWWVDHLPGQADMIRAQPWYRGVPFETRKGREGTRFYTGGFMAVRSELLREVQFPDTTFSWKGQTLKQYGGDTLLGEIANQLGWTRADHDSSIHVNVDLFGRHPAPRRGGSGRQFGSDVDVAIC